MLVLLAQLLPAPAALAAPAADTPICYNLVANGSFEEDSIYWRLTDSARPPAPSSAVVYDGAKSMRVGNDEGLPNLASESEIRSQPITLPANATSIILRFYYYPIHNAVPAENLDQDLQQALLYQVYDANDPKKDQLIEPIFTVQENDRVWKLREIPLSNYRGRAISLVFRVKNDGTQGLTLMYVDKVEMVYCTLTPIPTTTATFTPTTTPTPTASATQPTATSVPTLPPAPTATPAPVSPCITSLPANNVCYNLVVNGGFEYYGDWYIGEDPVPPRYISDQRHSGNQAMLLGNPPGGPNVNTYSSVRQLVQIPANATLAHLCFWRLYRSEEAPFAAPGPNNDRQEVIMLEPDLDVISILYRENRNDSGWQQQGISLNNFIGRTVNVYFNVYNNASPQHTWMYLDDVELFYCTAAPPPAPATAVPIATLPPPTATAVATVAVPPPATAITVITTSMAALPTPALMTNAVVLVQPLATPIGAVVAVVTPAAEVFAVANEQPRATTASVVVTVPVATSSSWWMRAGTVAILLGILVLIGFLVMAIWRLLRPEVP